MKGTSTLFFLLLSMIAFGQKESNNWYFGIWAGLDFNCDPPRAVSGIPHDVEEGCATISDSNGNILFFTDADSVWDRTLNAMPNGFGIGGRCTYHPNSATQAALILPKPGSTTLYYIFTVDCIEDTLYNGFRYSIVDMSLNNGKGDVTVKNQLLFYPSTEKIASVKHFNNTDYWIVAHEYGTNNFYSYRLTSSGLSAPIISSTGQVHLYSPVAPNPSCAIPEQIARGYLKFSPDGSKLVSLECPDDYPNGWPPLGKPLYALHPEIFAFDNNTGTVQSSYVIDHPDSLVYYGASFSPDGSRLYLSGAWFGSYIHQYNLLAGSQTAIVNSRTILFNDTTASHNVAAMQLATNGKLYVAVGYAYQWLDVINNPNALGTSCNFQQAAISLYVCPSNKYSRYGMPNFCESYFQTITPSNPCPDFINADFTFSDTCFNSSTQFNDVSTIFPETITVWKWGFNDPSSGAANYSNMQNPTHQFTYTGAYNVQLIVMTDTGVVCKTDTIIKTVNIQICTGINEINGVPFYATVFPNPFNQKFNLQIQPKNQMTIHITVYDVTGKIIETFEKEISKTTSINFGEHLTNGIYLLQIRSDNLIINKKLIKF